MTSGQRVELVVNGQDVGATVAPRLTLADFLRENCELRGVHLGCEQGVCGACTVLVDGHSSRSCLMLAVQAHHRRVDTVESLCGPEGKLSSLQQCFAELHGLQCGYCTPGILMTCVELLREDPHPSVETIRSRLSGNLCRCTGYVNIVRAVELAARLAEES